MGDHFSLEFDFELTQKIKQKLIQSQTYIYNHEKFEMAVKEDIKNPHKNRHLSHNNKTETLREELIITEADKSGATIIWDMNISKKPTIS